VVHLSVASDCWEAADIKVEIKFAHIPFDTAGKYRRCYGN
jgi:hypothetical protein